MTISQRGIYTVRTGIIELRARTLELPLLVRSGNFFSFFYGAVMALTPYPREGISDVLARDLIIPVLTVYFSDIFVTLGI